MTQKIWSFGLLAGLLAGLPLFAVTVLVDGQTPSTLGMLFGFTTMLIALSLIFVAIKRHRDVDCGGAIQFWPAFGLGLAISVVAGVLYVLAWEAALAVTGKDFAGEYARMIIAEQQAKGASADAIAKLTADMEQFKTQYAQPLYRWSITFIEIFPVGVLVSLVSAAVLRKSQFMPARRPA